MADSITVVITADAAGPGACLSSPGIRELLGRVRLVVVGGPRSAVVAHHADVQHLPAGRPGRASARNAGLAAADTPLVAFVDGHCRPRAGWLGSLVDGLGDHAAVLGQTRTVAEPASAGRWTVALDRTPGHPPGPPVSPLGGSALFDRRLLREVGAFSPRVRHWDDLYVTGRLLGYGCSVGYADWAVVDVRLPHRADQRLALLHRHGYWLEDLCRSNELRGSLRWGHRHGLHAWRLGWGRLARALRPPPAPCRPLPVHSRAGPAARPRTVHLTIDDGPSANTPALLRILRRYGARADFFVVGEQAGRYRSALEAITREGHGLHGHSLTHRQLDGLHQEDILVELDRTQRLIAPWDKSDRLLVRLPFGAGADDPYVHEAVRRWRPDCELVQWSIDSFDYKAWPRCATTADAEHEAAAAADRVLGAPDVPGSIILMHDSAYGVRNRGVDRFSQVLLDRTLAGLAQQGLTTRLLGEPGR